MEIQKFEYLENEKNFLDEIKNIFHSFWRSIIWWKIKICQKIADTSSNYCHKDFYLERGSFQAKTAAHINTLTDSKVDLKKLFRNVYSEKCIQKPATHLRQDFDTYIHKGT